MRNVCHIQTPENVLLEFELAGPGSRGVAVAIDTFIQNIILIIIYLILFTVAKDSIQNLLVADKNTFYIVIGLVLVFITQFGYFFLFEFIMGGTTPGKKLIGLKVIMANGEPLSASACLIRNFIRIGDMLPGFYAVGIFSVVFNRFYMRIGDLAANTVVVKVSKVKDGLGNYSTYNHTDDQQHRNIVLSHREETLLTEYRKRRETSPHPMNLKVIEAQMYHHFYGKIGIIPDLPDNFSHRAYLDKLMEYAGIM
jgi:uncharacterized RDD family membrane protein YckC